MLHPGSGSLVALTGLPGALLGPLVIFLGLALLLLQTVRVPFLGWVLFVLVLPVVIVLTLLSVRIAFRWLFAGHLAAAAAALEGGLAFNAYSRAFSWLRARPWRVTLLKFSGLGQALVGAIARSAGAG